MIQRKLGKSLDQKFIKKNYGSIYFFHFLCWWCSIFFKNSQKSLGTLFGFIGLSYSILHFRLTQRKLGKSLDQKFIKKNYGSIYFSHFLCWRCSIFFKNSQKSLGTLFGFIGLSYSILHFKLTQRKLGKSLDQKFIKKKLWFHIFLPFSLLMISIFFKNSQKSLGTLFGFIGFSYSILHFKLTQRKLGKSLDQKFIKKNYDSIYFFHFLCWRCSIFFKNSQKSLGTLFGFIGLSYSI